MTEKTTLLWFRQDLRLDDNPALEAALSRGGSVIGVYVWDEKGEGDWGPGAASRWWLHQSLLALGTRLRERGSGLVILRGSACEELQKLADETGADALYWNRCYEPASLARDEDLRVRLEKRLELRNFKAALLFEPDEISNKQGGPVRVFTPYWRRCLDKPEPLTTGFTCPAKIEGPAKWPASLQLEDLKLLPSAPWTVGFSAVWRPGELGASQALERFLKEVLKNYDDARDIPSVQGTSRLSPHLHFGEISPRRIWGALKALSEDSGVFPDGKGAQRFLAELGWREFAYHLLYHFPLSPTRPLRENFLRFPWASDPEGRLLRAWQRGRTGYPIVDAGMRELWSTGWMHNRVRMIAACFLVKHLRLPWQEGSRWFWDTLVDADLASNTLGWQWSAGCGADAAPYFRIFNPVLQGRNFDQDGIYVRRWVPELATMPDRYLHCPWEAPEEVCKAAGISLGSTYPRPLVDYAQARKEALAAFAQI
jgi:deoxyribodipyrimidine photo-lyase